MDNAARQVAVDALGEAESKSSQIPPLTTTYPDLTIEDAYAIQKTGIQARLASGGIVRGHKVGLSSVAMQEMLGVDECDYGHLLDDMFFTDQSAVSHSQFCQPRVEFEVAFVLADRLPAPGCTIADVLAATAFVLPSIEVIDTRIEDWKITLCDTIADNASSAGVVLGGTATNVAGIDLRTIGCVGRKNGEIVATGAAGAVLGHPATAVAWLANKLHEFEVELEAGHVILPGSCTKAIPVDVGDTVRAEFAQLGTVSISFGP